MNPSNEALRDIYLAAVKLHADAGEKPSQWYASGLRAVYGHGLANVSRPSTLSISWGSQNTTTITRELLESLISASSPKRDKPVSPIGHDIDSLRLIRIDRTLDVLLTALKEALAEITRLSADPDERNDQ